MTPTPIIPKADEVRVTPNLVGFCQEIMAHWPEGAPDGGDLQEIATKHGLLVPERRHSFCDKDEDSDLGACACRELCDMIDTKRGFDCYRRVDLRAPSPAVGGEVIEVTADMVRAASESQARDDEGEFPPLCDLIGFSGENKTRTVVRAALVAALEAFVRGRGKP